MVSDVNANALLEIRDLKVDLMTVRGIVYALDGVNLGVGPGEIHGLVGESGCGKSMTAKSILRLHDARRCRMSGEILFEGQDLCSLPRREMEKLRGRRVSMIFQDPMVSLNPLLTVGEQIAETIRAYEKAAEEIVRIPYGTATDSKSRPGGQSTSAASNRSYRSPSRTR